MHATLRTSLDGRVLTVTLTRPDRLNAFTVEMADELERLFRAVSEDDAVGAVIVTGEGRAFCAGMELAAEGNVFGLDGTQRPTLDDMRERLDDPAIRDGVRDTGGRVTLAIHDCKKPVIAAINGPAVGIGATMTLAMDFRLASAQARIGFVFGKLGIVPEACSSWFLPRLVGMQTALEWVLTAEIVSAETALEKGLLRSVHADREALLTEANSLARRIVEGRSPVAIALSRQMMRRNAALPDPLAAHRIDSLAMFYTSIGDGVEGVAAFREKREPEFAGRASDMPPIYPWW
ncbi:MAG: crotonase/enoyl-CoA hydratase family protein [Sphingobium sp.]